jgi:hypothetical protein
VTKVPLEAAAAHSYAIDRLPAITGLGRTRLYDAIKDGDLVARKFGHRTIVLREDLEAFLRGLERVK